MPDRRPATLVSLAACFALTFACSASSSAVNGGGSGGDTATGGSGGTTGGSATGGSATGGSATGGSAMSGSATGGSGGAASDTAGSATNDAGSSPSNDAGAPGDGAPPYANVTAVTASGSDGDYTFDVTVESADIDCSQFADWWEVLGNDGSLLYRRIIEHSHTDANGTSDPNAPGNSFTRSGGPVPVDASDVVIVRAHMSVGGYDGQVMRGSVADGFSAAPDISADFAANVETEDPQPTGCEF